MPKSPEASQGGTSVDKVNAELAGFNSLMSKDETPTVVVEDLAKMNVEAAGVLKAEARREKGKVRAEKMGQGMSKFFADVRSQVTEFMKPIKALFTRTKTVAAEAGYSALGAAETGVEKVGAAATEAKRWKNEDALNMEKSVVVQGVKAGADKAVDAAIAGGAILGGAAMLGAEAAVAGGRFVAQGVAEGVDAAGRGIRAGTEAVVDGVDKGARAVGRGAVKAGMFAGAVAAMPFVGAYKLGELAVKKGGEAAGKIKSETIAAMSSLDQAAQQVQGQVSGAIAEGAAIYGAAAQTARALKGGITEIYQANKAFEEDKQWVPYFESMMALPQSERDAKFNAMSPQDQFRVNKAYHERYQYMVRQQREQVAAAPQASQTQIGGSMN